MRHLAIYAALFVVALIVPACTRTPPPASATRVVYQDVVKEVSRPCPVKAPQRPGPLARPLPDSPGRVIDLLAAKLKEWAGDGGYGDRADAALKTCTKE